MLKPSSHPITESGGKITGYYAPTEFAGATSEAFATIDVGTMAEYESYRAKLAAHPKHQENADKVSKEGAILSIYRAIIQRVQPRRENTMTQPGSSIPGYDYGTAMSATSPLTDDELRHLELTIGWSSEDAETLQRYGELFRQQAESMVDSWRAVIGAQPHLAHWFVGPDGKPDEAYKTSVKRRFVQWVVDVALSPHDRQWLDYQEEIGLRHTPAKKNLTDNAHTPPLVPLRYLLGFIPVVLPVRKFFADAIKDEQELNALERAWTKAVLLHITLWTRPYTAAGLW